MGLLEIAGKSVKGNAYKYLMYYLSNSLAVMVFFIFANFIFNPEVGDIKYLGTPGALTAQGLIICEFIIVILFLLFVNYSITSFLKSREKEFGLLTLLGMTQSQVRRYITLENTIISLASILTGLFTGSLLSRLFFMAVEAILGAQNGMPFSIAYPAVLVTAAVFFLSTQCINFFCTLRIRHKDIIQLIRGSRMPKPLPRVSVFKSVCAVALIAFGYALALFAYRLILVTMIPIVAVTVIGTYFLFTQFSVLLTRWLQSRDGIFYKGTNMVTLSQVIYRLKDNARVLFIIAVSGAVAMTAAGSVYSAMEGMKATLSDTAAQDGMIKTFSLILFIGIFVAILFFIAAGSVIYFKMFNELKNDRAQLAALRKIGTTEQEMKRIVHTQTAAMFFLPYIVASLHAIVAISALEAITRWELKLYIAITCGIYLLLQTGFYLFARILYEKQFKF